MITWDTSAQTAALNALRAAHKHKVNEPLRLFCTGPGWWQLQVELVNDLLALGWDGDIHQTKEKFGGLRFYIGEGTEDQHNRIDQAEHEAAQTCEQCGKPGTLRKGGWIKTLCDTHDR